jgi:hypothetical protein
MADNQKFPPLLPVMKTSEVSHITLEQESAVKPLVSATEGEVSLLVQRVLVKIRWILFLSCSNSLFLCVYLPENNNFLLSL